MDSDTPIFKAFLRLDNKRLEVEIDKFSIRTWLAETGGIFNIIYSIFYVLFFYMARYIFMNKLIGEMFLVKVPKKDEQASL